ncbi:MAG: aminotransferase class V-fold PLP-dependent enzyme [Acidobacteria bacterium]|nr:aminotransferase class V-fold PLP-dependent enzyme [Acidobacteriota bacterium]
MDSHTHTGRHFLQIPGPTNVPDRVLRAMSGPTIDHRGPEFAALTLPILSRIRKVFATSQPVVIFPSSGTGAWEAALVNTLSPGDSVLMYESGQFAQLWRGVAESVGLEVEWIEGDWRHGVDTAKIEERLTADKGHRIRAVAVVHNETSTGVVGNIAGVRAAINAAGHPALLLVDTISSLGSIDYRHDEWGVDVTVGGSQKGLMLPPGLGFNAVSEKALQASAAAGLRRSYWDWQPVLAANEKGFFPYTPATNLLYGLAEALDMLLAEGMDAVFARHARLAGATRAALAGWGLENLAAVPAEYSNALTAVMMPEGHDADKLRALILKRFDMSLGTGLGKVQGRVFRIGHLGHFNELMLMGTLCGVEMGLKLAGVPHNAGGAAAAMRALSQ